MWKQHYDGTKVEKTQRWYMDKILSATNNPCSCSKAPKSYRHGECSSTSRKDVHYKLMVVEKVRS